MSDPRSEYQANRGAYLTALAVDRQNDPSQGPVTPDSEDLAWEAGGRYYTARAMPLPVLGIVMPAGRRVEATHFAFDETESAARLAALILDGSVVDLEA